MERMKQLHDVKTADARDSIKRANLAVKGIMIDGEWATDLENPIKRDEIRNAVWGCDENKSPAPDGFTFEFFRCNSSFIALIRKSLDPKYVSDYRPISLIGSLYKIVTKILATRLSTIIPDLISDVQTAFLPNRQIFDDGIIWRMSLNLLGSVLNGVRGFTQGDPLAPYLFIIIIESLHLSFSRVIDAGNFTSVWIDSSLMISHLFYADDAVFIGEWSHDNLKGIMHMLRCFSLMSGLSINLKKSHLLGVGIPASCVHEAAMSLGCSVMKALFKYLGIMVGGNMSLVKAWDDTVDKLKGRNFYNGIHDDERKVAWVKWSKVLASKNQGGLGVSSFYSLNRALLVKWVWRFLSHDNSLWARVIYVMHGSNRQELSASHSSTWSSILKEINILKAQGVDLISHCKIRVGNGLSTSFWNDFWVGDAHIRYMFPRLYALDSNKECTMADKMNAPLTSSFR
nr:RNA-directed DNA polymerase, eukaryota [Tanacetum cinerariifolium]